MNQQILDGNKSGCKVWDKPAWWVWFYLEQKPREYATKPTQQKVNMNKRIPLKDNGLLTVQP